MLFQGRFLLAFLQVLETRSLQNSTFELKSSVRKKMFMKSPKTFSPRNRLSQMEIKKSKRVNCSFIFLF